VCQTILPLENELKCRMRAEEQRNNELPFDILKYAYNTSIIHVFRSPCRLLLRVVTLKVPGILYHRWYVARSYHIGVIL